MKTRTDKVPNTSATAASSGADLNGAAIKNACDQLRARLAPVAAEMLAAKTGVAVDAGALHFADDLIGLLDPHEIEIVADFTVRGNIHTVVKVEHSKSSAKV